MADCCLDSYVYKKYYTSVYSTTFILYKLVYMSGRHVSTSRLTSGPPRTDPRVAGSFLEGLRMTD